MRESSRIYMCRQNGRQSTRAVRPWAPHWFRGRAHIAMEAARASQDYLLPMIESRQPRLPLVLARSAFSAAAVALLSCAPAAPASAPTPSTGNTATLPPVPPVDGPLAIRVVYPPSGAVVQARDSNFIFGSVGSGRATLTINGIGVPVIPNGSFLAFLPVPPSSAPQYAVVVSRGADTARAVHPIRVLPPRLVLADTGR